MTKLIADFCCNHLGQRGLIEEGIKRLAEIGIDYIKFQTFDVENLNKNYPNYNKMYDYYKSVQLSIDDHIFILKMCDVYGIEPLFTAFDESAARTLHSIGLTDVKIASPDADNWKLLELCDRTFEHMFISCGMISSSDLCRLRKFYKKHTFFYCISKYPTAFNDINFDRMVLFDGFSDHTEDIKAATEAIRLGLSYVERHFTLGKDLPGKDHAISSTVDEFRQLVEYRNYVESIKKYKSRWIGGR